MLYLPDSNILIYAKMAAMSEHKAAQAWLFSVLQGPASKLLLCETTVLSFLRITTNAKVFSPQLPYSEALTFITSLLKRPNVILQRSQPEHFIDVATYMVDNGVGGNLVMDVHLALTALATGAVMVTRDADFKKVPYLRTINPL